MAKKKTSADDRYVRDIRRILEEQYGSRHPRAVIDVVRYNPVSVRVRIVDPDFAAQSWTARDTAVWQILRQLPEDTRAELSMLALLTPEESKAALMNFEFEQPSRSRI